MKNNGFDVYDHSHQWYRRFSLRSALLFSAITASSIGLAGRFLLLEVQKRAHLDNLEPLMAKRGWIVWDSMGNVKAMGFEGQGSLKITDADVRTLPLKELEYLAVLDLSDSDVSDEAIEILRQLKSLRRVDLRNTRVSEEGRNQLKLSIPECNVVGRP
jgi:hypothetical protein